MSRGLGDVYKRQAELDQVADKLRAEGKEAAADQIKKAVDEFKKGNLYLGLALATVKEQ